MRKITLLSVCLTLTVFTYAQHWKIFNSSNSFLPADDVIKIALDNSNNKWMGTEAMGGTGGLAKFDGSVWTTYNSSNSSMPISATFAVAVDGNDNVWLGTSNLTSNAICMLDNISLWTVHNSGIPSGFPSCIAIESNNTNVWIGTNNLLGTGGVGYYNGTSWTIYNSTNSSLPGPQVYDIAIDGNNDKWIATNNGLAKFNGTTWTIYNTSNSNIPNNTVLSVFIDGSTKWIGTEGGLAKYDGTSWTVYSTSNSNIPDNTVSTIAKDNSGNIWVGTGGTLIGGGGAGIAKFDGTSTWVVYNTSNSSLPSDDVNSIIIESNDDIWIGTCSGLAFYGNTSVSINDLQETKVAIYPNPADYSVTFEFYLPAKDNVSIKITDMQGKDIATVIEQDMSAGKHKINYNTDELQAGIYMYHLQTTNYSTSSELTIIK